MLKINAEVFDYSKDLEVVKGLLNGYILFLNNPEEGIEAVNGLEDGEYDEIFAKVRKGLGGEFTSSKAVEVGISVFRKHIANHINTIKEGILKNAKLLKDAIETVNKNNDIINNTQDTTLLENRYTMISKDMVRKEYADSKIAKILPTMLGNDENADINTDDLLCRLASSMKNFKPYSDNTLQSNINMVKNNIKLINAYTTTDDLDSDINVDTPVVKNENTETTLADLIPNKVNDKCDKDTIDYIRVMIDSVTTLHDLTEQYLQTLNKYVSNKQDTTIMSILDKVIEIANTQDFTTEELQLNIEKYVKLLTTILELNKAYSIYILNGYIELNNGIRNKSRYIMAVDKITTEASF